MAFASKSFIASLTQRAGTYQMMDSDGAVLYVGKAKNLKKRVSSYFRKSGISAKTSALVKRISDIDITVTETETEALILEQNLIKKHRPTFNILMRDDKSYPYILLTDKDQWPRLSFHRGPKKLTGTYFGPYPSVNSVRESMSLLQRVFKVRQCEDSFFKNRSRPCLQYQINRCSGPCVNLATEEDYQTSVELTRKYLEGKSDEITKQLEQQMDRASDEMQYERAAEMRDQIKALRQVQAQQVIEKGRGIIDVIAASLERGQACIHILYIRQGRILGSRSFYPKIQLSETVEDLLSEFLPQIYLNGHGRSDIPKEIITSNSFEGADALTEALEHLINRSVKIKHSVRGARAKWMELATRTANLNLQARLLSTQTVNQRFESLKETLGFESTPERIECFDVSHSSGESTVASCVVFDSNGPVKNDYRKFNIKGVKANDDYAAMKQALERRYKRLVNGEGQMPDILLIDGGKGQLSVAKTTLAELGVVGVTIIGVAKGTTRKAGFETLIFAETNHVITDPDQAALHLIQQIRDEAHRFAITGHKQQRDKKRRISALEGIPGVGPKRRRDLLKHFGGIVEVKKASVADLMKVSNINKQVAESIYAELCEE
jgi:excinuclease ABC subunit C